MFELLPRSSAAIFIIFIILAGVLFLSQTLVKFIFYLISIFKKSDYSGYEVLDLLKTKNYLENSKNKVKKICGMSSYFAYKKIKNEFVISNYGFKKENLHSNLKAMEMIVYANEKNNKSFTSSWEFKMIGILSTIPYILIIIMFMLTYIPTPDNNGQVAMKYWISIEALSIIGWIVILITWFWWMNIIQNYQIELEDQLLNINNRDLDYKIKSYLNVVSYIPFSIRTII